MCSLSGVESVRLQLAGRKPRRGLGRHTNTDIRRWAPPLAPIPSKGHLHAGPVLASESEPAMAWLVWGLLGIDKEVQERGVTPNKHVTPL